MLTADKPNPDRFAKPHISAALYFSLSPLSLTLSPTICLSFSIPLSLSRSASLSLSYSLLLFLSLFLYDSNTFNLSGTCNANECQNSNGQNGGAAKTPSPIITQDMAVTYDPTTEATTEHLPPVSSTGNKLTNPKLISGSTEDWDQQFGQTMWKFSKTDYIKYTTLQII